MRASVTRWPRTARAAFLACAGWLAVYELHVVLVPGVDAGPLFSRYAHDIVLLVASVLCIAGGLRRRGGERAAWLLIGAGVLAWSFGEIFYTAVMWDDADPPIPSPADGGYLLFPVLALAGGLSLLRASARG